MNKTIGFIGSGNMGGAMIGGIIKAGLTAKAVSYTHLTLPTILRV